MKRHDRRILGAGALLFALIALPARVAAQERPGMAERQEEMMARHQEMMAEQQEMMARVDSLTAVMNEASGEARIDAMTALLNELVAQHRAMHEHMKEMMSGMMGAGHGHEMHAPPSQGAAPEEETDGHEHPEEPEN
jgi:TolA-binding protein